MKTNLASIVRKHRDEVATSDDVAPDMAARIGRWLQPQQVVLDCAATSSDDVLRAAVAKIGESHPSSATHLFDALRRRELAASTALAHGFALPHARVGGAAEPVLLYLRSAVPLWFGAAGNAKTSHFLVVVVPAGGDPDDHLQLLAAVARLVSMRRFRHELERADTPELVQATFRAGIRRIVRG